jgi:hypothetical protein
VNFCFFNASRPSSAVSAGGDGEAVHFEKLHQRPPDRHVVFDYEHCASGLFGHFQRLYPRTTGLARNSANAARRRCLFDSIEQKDRRARAITAFAIVIDAVGAYVALRSSS